MANKFFANQGFMVDTRIPYDYPRKHIIEGTGYLFGDDKKSLKATIDNVVYDEVHIIM